MNQLSVRNRLETTGKIYGVVTAVVTSVRDTKQNRHTLGYVQIYFPWLQDENDPKLINPWARLVRAEGGNAGDIVFPQVGDEVLVIFEHGDIHYPYVLRTLWSQK